MAQPKRSIRALLVVDGYFSLGGQDRDDRSFSISWLISVLKSHAKIYLDTAHRDGDHSASIWGKFNFATTVPDLSHYDEIWMLGYNGLNKNDPSNALFKKPLDNTELQALAHFMQNGGGVLATGDHDGLGSYMCGRIPRVRTMRKWFSKDDQSEHIPDNAPRNWPANGSTRADTLQMGTGDTFHFTNQSDDIPQPLELLRIPGESGDYHPLFKINGGRVLRQFPDHMHEGETLGFGGVTESVPWTLNDVLTFNNEAFTEYPTKDGHQETPRIIATGSVIGGHVTTVEPNKLCESGFMPEGTVTEAKKINTLSVYDGHKVDVGRVLTDSSFHHFIDLNLIGDPCATAEKTRGFQTKFLDEMSVFFVNCVMWLANRRVWMLELQGHKVTAELS